MPIRNYKIPFLRGVLNKHQCILQDQGSHYYHFRTNYKMSYPKEEEEVLDFEPYEDEAEDFSARAKDAELNLQHLTLAENEAKSMETESVASSYPGNVGDIALPKPPTTAQENDRIEPQLDDYIKKLVEEKICQTEQKSEARIKEAEDAAEAKILALREDQVLGVNPENRSGIMCWGDLRFDKITNLKLICISNFFQAWKLIAKNFPTPPGSKDNSWIRQALFHNSNIVTKIPSQNARGYKMTHLEPIYFGFPNNCCLKICDIYSGGQLKSKEDISTLINDKYRSDDFTLAEGSHLRLVRAMKFIVGHREKMEGIDLVFPMTFPSLNPNPPKNSSSTLKALASKIEKGSQKYRQILTKDTGFITTARLDSWKEVLKNENILHISAQLSHFC